jgi:hypothetical protein
VIVKSPKIVKCYFKSIHHKKDYHLKRLISLPLPFDAFRPEVDVFAAIILR